MALNRTTTQARIQPVIRRLPASDATVREAVVERTSLRAYVLVTAIVYFFSSIPYLFGYLSQTGGMRFTGIVFDVVDTAQYFAWMRSFSDSVLIANPLTPEPGASRFFNLQWWLLGLLAFKTPLGAVVTYQLLRIVALACFAGAVGWFCRLVVPRHAFLAFVLVMVSSGFGWIWVLEKQLSGELRYPLDVQIAEANTFFSAMAFPHLLIAGAMMVTIFCLCLEATLERRWRFITIACALTLALGFSHGYDLIPTMAIPGATAFVLLLRQRRIPSLAWPVAFIVLAALPPALYALALTWLDDTWSGVLSQYGNAGVYTPLPHHLLVLLGLPFLLALPQLRPSAWSGVSDRQLFVRVWLIVGFFLLYIPTDYQVKMLTAYQIPACILAVRTLAELYGSRWFVRPSARKLAPAVVVTTVAFVMLTNLYLTAWRVVDLRRAGYPYFMTAGDVTALERLEPLVQPGDVVLSSEELGVFVPVYTDARPYIAHWAQTLDYHRRRAESRHFYRLSASEVERATLIHDNDIAFVLSGPAEAAFGEGTPDVDLALDLELIVEGPTKVYRTDQVTGIEVTP